MGLKILLHQTRSENTPTEWNACGTNANDEYSIFEHQSFELLFVSGFSSREQILLPFLLCNICWELSELK